MVVRVRNRVTGFILFVRFFGCLTANDKRTRQRNSNRRRCRTDRRGGPVQNHLCRTTTTTMATSSSSSSTVCNTPRHHRRWRLLRRGSTGGSTTPSASSAVRPVCDRCYGAVCASTTGRVDDRPRRRRTAFGRRSGGGGGGSHGRRRCVERLRQSGLGDWPRRIGRHRRRRFVREHRRDRVVDGTITTTTSRRHYATET